MKKLLSTVLALTGVFALAACGGGGQKAGHKDGEQVWAITGPACLKVNGKTAEEAGGAAWDFGGDAFILKETTVEKVKGVDATVGAALEAKGAVVTGLYSIEKVEFGVADAGYTKPCMIDGVKKIANASYTGKIILTEYGAEDETWATQQWVPDPHTAHVEVLTPSTYFAPSWQEEADENGFSWSDDSVVIGGAGLYTVVLAKYSTPASEDSCNYGLAYIKTEAKQGHEYADVPSETVYSLIGDFNSWGADVDMVETDGVFKAQVTLAVDQGIKVRANHDWAESYGSSAVESAPDGAFDLSGDNIVCKLAGTYEFAFNAANSKITITAVAL